MPVAATTSPRRRRRSKDPARVALGGRVRALRRERRLTQEDLAVRARISPIYVSMLERGESSPSMAVAGRLAEALQVPRSELWRAAADEPYADAYFAKLVAFAQQARLSRADVDRWIRVGSALFGVGPDHSGGPVPAPPRPESACTVRGCTRPVKARGRCAGHYASRRRSR